MPPTRYPAINALLDDLLDCLCGILDDQLAGVYLFGSLRTGDYDPGSSDIDVLAALNRPLDDDVFAALDRLHGDLIRVHLMGEDRLEIAYVTLEALRTFKTETHEIAIISPGEPFHRKDAGNDWLLNWANVRQHGLALWGPPPEQIIEPVSPAEFHAAVLRQAGEWRTWIDTIGTRPGQAYAILTLCRALYAAQTGQQASKLQAARWAARELPAWSGLIEQAVAWRRAWRDQDVDHAATLAETRRFVLFVIDQILG